MAQNPEPSSAGSLILSNEHLTGSFHIAKETLASEPTGLTIELTSVQNPAQMPVGVFVYLDNPKNPDRRKLLGNFALYPPDRPGKFLLNPTAALRWYKTYANNPDASLTLEIKRLDPSRPWTHVEVVIAPPTWTRNTN